MIRGEFEFERAVRLCPAKMIVIDGKRVFPCIASDGSIEARFVVYLVGETKNPKAPSIDASSLGFGVADFAEMRTSAAVLLPMMTENQALSEMKRAISALDL